MKINFTLLILLTFLFGPINIYAYSSYIVPGGNTLGIEVGTDGIMIIGFYKVQGKYNKGSFELKKGDYIIKVNDSSVNSVNDMTNIIEDNLNKNSIKITFRRNDSIFNTNILLLKEDNKYKTGLYVKDTIKGIGTLSYIDPETNIFGALGHEIIESTTSDIVEIRTGSIFENNIIGIEKSVPGTPGSKIAKFNTNNKYGIINKNTMYGIFGTYNREYDSSLLLNIDNPKIGKAFIRTVLNEQIIKDYEVNIKSINGTSLTKNIIIEISDNNLIDLTGGIIQGMSGSPIIQNNKIVGVLTHVVIDNPITGYGIFIKTMLEEGEK